VKVWGVSGKATESRLRKVHGNQNGTETADEVTHGGGCGNTATPPVTFFYKKTFTST